jgi:hypothetical protein
LHTWPLIIDEVQYAPALFDVIESIVNNQKLETGNNSGMYILTGSQAYELMNGVSVIIKNNIKFIINEKTYIDINDKFIKLD